MYTHIILLRGVIPTGKNRVPMAQLREVMAAAGYGRVRTWIASGNLLVDTRESAPETAARVRALIKQEIGPDLAVVARSPEEVARVLADNPFEGAGHDPARVFYAFFETRPGDDKLAALKQRDFGDNKLIITDFAAYMYIPGDYTKAKLNAAVLEKATGVAITMRNGNTLNKLVEMANERA